MVTVVFWFTSLKLNVILTSKAEIIQLYLGERWYNKIT